jgi:2-aminoadipate transaminase
MAKNGKSLNMTNWNFANRAAKLNPSVLREILKVTEQPGIISFAGGLPSAKTFPVREFKLACDAVLEKNAHSALQYAASEGFQELREQISETLSWKPDPNQILITTGSQQGLDLIAKLFIDKGSKILVESPTYLGALQAFSIMEPDIVCVESNADDLNISDLDKHRKNAKFIYLLPNFQNPTGKTISENGREIISNYARERNLLIIEDNPYGELWFDTPPPISLTARNPEGCIYLGSLSKILAPGLRLGFLVAPPTVYPKLLQAKQAADLHSPIFNQRIASEVMKGEFLSNHIPMIRSLYKSQCKAMIVALNREMSDLPVTWNAPAGGMFIWLSLPNYMNATTLLPNAIKRGVAFVPGESFYTKNPELNNLRLSFVTASKSEIDTGIALLAQTIREEFQNSIK